MSSRVSALPHLTDGEQRAFDYAERMLKAARLRGQSSIFYGSALAESTVITGAGTHVAYRRADPMNSRESSEPGRFVRPSTHAARVRASLRVIQSHLFYRSDER
jgi:hypothetical protein